MIPIRTITACVLALAAAGTGALFAIPDDPQPTTMTCVADVVDGDSIHCNSVLVRIAGIDAPETLERETCYARLGRGRLADQMEELVLGDAARRALDGLLAEHGYRVTLREIDYTSDRYGRPIAVVWAEEVLVAGWMIDHGFAVEYSGERREAWCGG